MFRAGKGFYNDDDVQPLLDSNEEKKERNNEHSWNAFKNTPRKSDSGSASETKKYDFTVKTIKILSYIVVFCVVLCCAVLSKGTLLLMTSQVKSETTRDFCNKYLDVYKKFQVELPTEERVIWIWMIIFTYFVPQIGLFVKSVRICIFKSWSKNHLLKHFIPLFITESFPAVGSAILVFCILPELDVLKGVMLTNAFCFVPGIIGLISRNDNSKFSIEMALDIISIIAQFSSFLLWPIIEGNSKLFLIPASAIFISFGWWENYVDENARFPFIRKLAEERRVFQNRTYFLYIFISITNCLIFLATTVFIFWVQEDDFGFVFDNFGAAFSNREINVTEVKIYVEDLTPQGIDDTFTLSTGTTEANLWTPFTILIINFLSSYICYAFSKFASKVSIQEVSFALAAILPVPVLLSTLIIMTGGYLKDECAYIDLFPGYLFFNPSPIYTLSDFFIKNFVWLWWFWWLSQVWITRHIWKPRCQNLARTEQLFLKPLYDAFLIDQSVCTNRRRDDRPLQADREEPATNPKIFVCATMWHEEKEEMLSFMKSIMRLDEDHCAHRIAKYYMHIDPPTHYELECNIFFDDAFIRRHKDDQDPMLNSYVLNLIPTIEKAASEVHGINIKLRPPRLYATPYGGRLEWTLPGRTKLITHLKDKAKIRAKKRWSQVMYMYYLLGYRLLPSMKQNTAKSENTFILALDGDIDFKAEAVHLLMEYMKINKKLGAACGRIHPVGSGAIAWYQIFEYAVGHWLQKATEHVIGCVLCSPGCFSLFRAEVLMQDRVMCKYTTEASQPRHRVQYDQGEDRWLCTLILQAGYRVEYSAASDSYTHCPESFSGFYKQRRRWIPSTMANILDVVEDYKNIVNVNDDISMMYIFYQVVLLVGTVIGPGTIFLMLVGATVAVFQLDQWTSFLVNLLPILIFVLICALCKEDVQLMVAGILSSIYGLIMMAVLLGVILQIHDDGVLAPTSIFFFFMILEFVVAAILHPKEFYCLKYGIIYYVTVPSMYMLLIIFSVFNMDNVSWGTRDVTVVPDEKKPDDDEKAADDKKDKKNMDLVSIIKEKSTDEGSLELSCAGLFKCFFCAHPSDQYVKLQAIQEAIDKINSKLDCVESSRSSTVTNEDGPIILEGAKAMPKVPGKKGDSSKNGKGASNDGVMSNSWFYHDELINGEVEWLEDKEEKFWSVFIEKYLTPIDETGLMKVIGMELRELRDKMVFTFFMINALFVLVIFLLTLKKDIIHINWPYNAKVNFTYVESENEVRIMKDYLHLEPIGFVFLIFFGALLITQSIGMFIHRFATFSQILANTAIDWNILKSNTEKDSDALKYVTKDNAVRLAKKLQQLHDVNKSKEEIENEQLPPGKRKSVFKPPPGNETKVQIYDLVDSYKARMKMYDDEDFKGPVDRKTVDHIKYRHSQVIRKSQANLLAQTLKAEEEPKETAQFYGMEPLDGLDTGETFS